MTVGRMLSEKDFIEFFHDLRDQNWWPDLLLQPLLHSHAHNGIGKLQIVVLWFDGIERGYMSPDRAILEHPTVVGYIQRGPARMLAIMQKLLEAKPGPPPLMEEPQPVCRKMLRRIEL